MNVNELMNRVDVYADAIGVEVTNVSLSMRPATCEVTVADATLGSLALARAKVLDLVNAGLVAAGKKPTKDVANVITDALCLYSDGVYVNGPATEFTSMAYLNLALAHIDDDDVERWERVVNCCARAVLRWLADEWTRIVLREEVR